MCDKYLAHVGDSKPVVVQPCHEFLIGRLRRGPRIQQCQFFSDEDIAVHPPRLKGGRNLKAVDIVHAPLFSLLR